MAGQDVEDDMQAPWRLRHGADPVDVASVLLTTPPDTGSRGSSGLLAALTPPASFADVDARARRLVQWAHEEAQYVRTRDVGLFSSADVAGRNHYAEEALYELLPALHADAARLRLACGRGPLWSATRQLCRSASQAVQEYCLLWDRLRSATGR